MTKIDEIMALVHNMASDKEIRQALEAALKPGALNKDKARKVAQCAFVIFPHVNGKFPAEQALNELVGYTAPPAQTPAPPPRLVDWQIEAMHWGEMCNRDLSFARAIESAVRKQFGVNDE